MNRRQREARSTDAGEDRQYSYPTDHLLGVLDTREQAASAVDALTSGGFLSSEVHVAAGSAAAAALAERTGRTGLTDLVIRIAERFGLPIDEMRVKDRYEQALRDGRYVLIIAALTEERRERATQILREHGAHDVNFLGRFTIERIIPSEPT